MFWALTRLRSLTGYITSDLGLFLRTMSTHLEPSNPQTLSFSDLRVQDLRDSSQSTLTGTSCAEGRVTGTESRSERHGYHPCLQGMESPGGDGLGDNECNQMRCGPVGIQGIYRVGWGWKGCSLAKLRESLGEGNKCPPDKNMQQAPCRTCLCLATGAIYGGLEGWVQ